MLRLTTLTAVVFLTAACGSSSVDVPVPVAPTPTPPPTSSKVSFIGFVSDQFANTDDTAEPVEINDIDFEFDANDNPQAFNRLLGNDGS